MTVLALGLAAPLAGACGGAAAGGAPSYDAASAKDAPRLETLDDAQAALDHAEASLASFGVHSSGDAGAAASPTAPLPQSTATPLSEPPRPGEDAPTDRCVTACAALESMRRAADRVCVLAPGEHCDAATARVGAAETRVFEACPGCAT